MSHAVQWCVTIVFRSSSDTQLYNKKVDTLDRLLPSRDEWKTHTPVNHDYSFIPYTRFDMLISLIYHHSTDSTQKAEKVAAGATHSWSDGDRRGTVFSINFAAVAVFTGD